MSISSSTRKAGPYSCNGATVAFPFSFKVFAAADVRVVLTDVNEAESDLVLGTNYTVTLNADQDANPGGTVTTITTYASGYLITLTSQVQNLQPVTLTNQGGFYPKVINTALDRLTILVQQVVEQVGRAVKTPISSGLTPDQLIADLYAVEANAGNSATAAANSAANAAASAAAAAAVLDNFDDRYLGEKTSDPTLDNDGNPLATGALYFNTVSGVMRVYTGTSWIDAAMGVNSDDVAYLAPATGASSRTAQDKLYESISVKDFGADPTGLADSSMAFQAAINAAALRGGGTVWVEPGLYKISTMLTTTKAVVLRGTVRTDISSNTNGGGYLTAKPTILWTGSAGAYMYTIHPAVVGDCVWGGGSIDIEWNGNDLAAVAVWLDNTKYAVFDGKVRRVTYAGVLVNSVSGGVGNFSMKNHIRSLEFVWGVVAACQNAHGLLLGGNGSTVPATQQLVGDVSGLVYNGSLVHVTETDNAQFLSVHGVVQAPGTGAAVNLVNAGAQGSNHNFFVYCVGPVKLDNGLVGNVFLNYNSEGGGIAQTSGSSSWDGELVDYGTGERFTSHKYALRDKITLTAGDFVGDTTTARDALAFQWVCTTLNNAATMTASCIIPAPYWLSAGVIEAVEFYVGTNGTSAGNYRLTYKLSTGTLAGPAVTPERTDTVTVAAGAQYTPTKLTWTPSSELPFAKGDHIFLTIQRLGADALDTNSDAMMLVGARILYRSSGPTTGGSGSYSIPSWA